MCTHPLAVDDGPERNHTSIATCDYHLTISNTLRASDLQIKEENDQLYSFNL